MNRRNGFAFWQTTAQLESFKRIPGKVVYVNDKWGELTASARTPLLAFRGRTLFILPTLIAKSSDGKKPFRTGTTSRRMSFDLYTQTVTCGGHLVPLPF